jgi:hypothetical protein
MIIVGPTLPEPYYSDVEAVWSEIAEEFGHHGVSNPIPHFTLYGLDGTADIDALEGALETALGDWDPFEVRTDGLGIFPGDHVWIPVAKSPSLTTLQQDVVEVAQESQRVGDIVRFLRTFDFDFERQFTVDNVEITHRPAGAEEFERVASVPF